MSLYDIFEIALLKLEIEKSTEPSAGVSAVRHIGSPCLLSPLDGRPMLSSGSTLTFFSRPHDRCACRRGVAVAAMVRSAAHCIDGLRSNTRRLKSFK